MKLRTAKKILRNWQKDICNYSHKTLHDAGVKYRPYLISECRKKNEELKAAGNTQIFYAPYIMKWTNALVGDSCQRNIPKNKTAYTKYAVMEVNKDFYYEFTKH